MSPEPLQPLSLPVQMSPRRGSYLLPTDVNESPRTDVVGGTVIPPAELETAPVPAPVPGTTPAAAVGNQLLAPYPSSAAAYWQGLDPYWTATAPDEQVDVGLSGLSRAEVSPPPQPSHQHQQQNQHRHQPQPGTVATEGLSTAAFDLTPFSPISLPAPSSASAVTSQQPAMPPFITSATPSSSTIALRQQPQPPTDSYMQHLPPRSIYSSSPQSTSTASTPQPQVTYPTYTSPVLASQPHPQSQPAPSASAPPAQPPPPPPQYQPPYPSYSLPAMNGPVWTNVSNPTSNQMTFVGGMVPPSIVPYGPNSGYVAQMHRFYGANASANSSAGGADPTAVLAARTGFLPPASSIPTDRPFRCDMCRQSFNRNHDLKRHKRIHLAVKPFPCGHCDKSFSRKDALKVCVSYLFSVLHLLMVVCSDIFL